MTPTATEPDGPRDARPRTWAHDTRGAWILRQGSPPACVRIAPVSNWALAYSLVAIVLLLTGGTVRLVGTDSRRIFNEVSELLADENAYRRMAGAVNPYGDGNASRRIIQALEHAAGRGPAPQPFEV